MKIWTMMKKELRLYFTTPVAYGVGDDGVDLHPKLRVARLDVGEDDQVGAGVDRLEHALLDRIVVAHRAHLHVVAEDHALKADIALGPQRMDGAAR